MTSSLIFLDHQAVPGWAATSQEQLYTAEGSKIFGVQQALSAIDRNNSVVSVMSFLLLRVSLLKQIGQVNILSHIFSFQRKLRLVKKARYYVEPIGYQ